MARERIKKILKLIFKILITILAVYVVIRKIDVGQTLKVISQVNLLWLIPALILYNASKSVGAFRLKKLLECIKIPLPNILSLKLCYIGMFYNLFLPGGIGGDGYKVYLVNKHYKKTPLKLIVAATLLDRISGLVALIFLALVVYNFTSMSYTLMDMRINALIYFSIAACFPIFYLVFKWMFKSFRSAFVVSNMQSLALQVIQVVAALFILYGLGIDENLEDYLGLFLVSSVVAVLPFTIGGVGARELVFIFGYSYLPIDKNVAVAFSVLFFVITALSSLTGVLFNVTEREFSVNNRTWNQ